MARLDFLRFHRNRCVSNGSDGLHRTTFQPSSKYCLHFRFHLMTKLPVTQVDSSELPVSFSTRLRRTPGFVHWNLVESIGHVCSVMELFHVIGRWPVSFLYISLVDMQVWKTTDQSPYCRLCRKLWRKLSTFNYNGTYRGLTF